MQRCSERQSRRAIQKLLTQLNLQQCLSLDECIEMQHTEVGEAAGSESAGGCKFMNGGLGLASVLLPSSMMLLTWFKFKLW